VLATVIVIVTAAPGPKALLFVVAVVDAIADVGFNSVHTLASGLVNILKLFKL